MRLKHDTLWNYIQIYIYMSVVNWYLRLINTDEERCYNECERHLL